MHEFRRFIQKQLDDQGLRQADLATRSGLTRSHVSKLMRDHREHLGQMPDSETIDALARGFGVPAERVRTAAARSLARYSDDGSPITIELGEIPTDALLNELKRRIEASESGADDEQVTQPRTQESSPEHGGTGSSSGKPGAPIAADPSDFRKAASELGIRVRSVFRDDEAVGEMMDDARETHHPDKAHALLELDQGSDADEPTQAELDLARRSGETKRQWELRTQIQPEDEPQGEAPEEGA